MIKGIPRFLYPGICGMRGRMKRKLELRGDGGRDLVFALFFVLLEVVTYAGTLWMLRMINRDPTLIFIPPAQPLSLLLACLSVMMFLAALAHTYDTFLQAYDLDLIFASPTRGVSFFCGRFLTVVLAVGWMPALLLVPILASFGQAYGAGLSFYLLAPLTVTPYFVIPAALGFLVMIVFARFVPGDRSREFLILLAVLFIGLLFYLADLAHGLWASRGSENQVLVVAQLLTRGEVSWLPSFWTAKALEDLMLPSFAASPLYLVLASSVTVSLVSLSYLLYVAFYREGFDLTRSRKQSSVSFMAGCISALVRAIPVSSSALRALLRKELLLFSREITQIVQLLMLSSLVVLYIYNLQAFISAQAETSEVELWYQRFTFMGNFSVGAFIAIAACTRLVFPSLSLEGRSFWVLQTAPVTFSSILRVKFWHWYVPVATLSLTLFMAGALTVGVSLPMAICYGFSSLCIAYGVVGAACGLGATYSRFDWESPSQLCAGFGSLVYMLYSSFLLLVTMVPTWYMLFATSLSSLTGSVTSRDLMILVLNGLTVLLINYCGARLALKSGERALEKRRELASA